MNNYNMDELENLMKKTKELCDTLETLSVDTSLGTERVREQLEHCEIEIRRNLGWLKSIRKELGI